MKTIKNCETCVHHGTCVFPFSREDAIRANTCRTEDGKLKNYKAKRNVSKSKKTK